MVAGIRSEPIPLDPDRPGVTRAGELDFVGALALDASQVPGFGGLSGLWMSPDRSRMVAVTDRGGLVGAELRHDGHGRLIEVRDVRVRALPDADGRPANGSRADAEDLARLPDGRWVVSFERRHRIQVHARNADRPDGPATVPPAPRGFGAMDGNSGVEALAAFPDGRLLAIEEGPAGRALHQAWIWDGEEWAALSYLTRSPFRPTAAAILPDGGLLVLERRFGVISGFGSRIVHVPAATVAAAAAGAQGAAPGGLLEGRELARIEPPLISDNFEGIAVLPAAGGGLDIYLLSDDNFMPFQRTILAQFRWQP